MNAASVLTARYGILSNMRHLAKVELHVHLDCSLSYKVAQRLEPSLSRERYEREFIAPERCASLADFLTRAPTGFQLMQTEDSLRLVTEDLFEQFLADRVLYAEIRFAPLLHINKGLSAERVVEVVERAAESASRASGVEARIILCTLRHFNQEESLQTAQLVHRSQGGKVVALDLAGDEAAFAIDAHIPAYHYAIEHDLGRTAHAGEACGAGSVWQTLNAFSPVRIGHGVRSVEDPALVDHLAQHRIHLEICPSSNIQTGIYAAYGQHPVNRLFQAGLSLGISTDARTLTGITLTEEYEKLHQHFGWGAAEFARCNNDALEAAFIDEPLKQSLRQKLAQASTFSDPSPVAPALGLPT